MYRVVGIGDLVCDIYYKDGEIVGINGGKTFANIIFNLANMNVQAKIIGTCGSDIYGKIAMESLKIVGIDISNVKMLNMPTNLFNVCISNKRFSTKKRCPICNTKKWYDYTFDKIITNNDDIIVIDCLRYLSLLKDKTVLIDIGYFNELEKMNEKEFIDFLNFNFEIINMNNRVYKYLKTKLNLKNEKELFNKLNTKLLIITKGKKGTSYYFNDNHIIMDLTEISQEVDPNGAGDLFFASTIKDYLNNNLITDEKFIKTSFENASNLTKEIVKVIGARTYYQPLYKVRKLDVCACTNLTISKNS